MSLEKYEEAVSQLRSLLQRDPLHFYGEGMSIKYASSRGAKREHSSLYTHLGWIIDNLYAIPSS
jgi:hypothetical protein